MLTRAEKHDYCNYEKINYFPATLTIPKYSLRSEPAFVRYKLDNNDELIRKSSLWNFGLWICVNSTLDRLHPVPDINR